jgi:amino acid transporter
MEQRIKIPLWIAVLININIIIGAAFFVVVPKISSSGGVLAPFAWLLCGLILLPLVIVLAKLAHTFPSAGGLYVYSLRQLGPTWGFISGWSYFIGSTAFNAIVIHAFCQDLQRTNLLATFFKTTHLTGLAFDAIVILFFALFNLLNVKFLEGFQIGLIVFKTIPLLAIIIAVPFLFDVSRLSTITIDFSNFLETIPLVLFAYIGIEACCSIADKIEDGKKNAGKVIFISFALVITLYTVLQFALLLIHGSSGTGSFLSILPRLTSNQSLIVWGNYFIHLSILFAFLGSFYGMFYFNNWNLFAIAEEKHLPFASILTKLNKNETPWTCVLVQSSLAMLFLIFANKEYSLAIMGDFGTMIAYLLSVIAFLTLYKKVSGYLALVSSFVLIYLCTKNLFSYGLNYLLPFIGVIAVGIIAHQMNEWRKRA